ncbi:pyruvate kinase [Patescibacteria group bacterium]|nr:pyruvate kinase [Patescibacteria group bacterium]
MLTKIIATVGPNSEAPESLLSLFKAGVNMLRINFSHANYQQFKRIKKIVDRYNLSAEEKISIMLDLQGPRIRVGTMPEGGILMLKDQLYDFTYSKKPYVKKGDIIPIDNLELCRDIKKGEVLFLCNGAIELQVIAVKNKIITAKVINGGVLNSRKAINVPDTNIKKGGMTAKDLRDAQFGVKNGTDYIALSFVQTANDVLRLRKLLGKKSKIKIISKIERGIALKNIDKIITASDAIMVARGDLGIETPIEDLPIIQKNLVRHTHWHNKPVIIATQVMTSMIKNAHPTRAEISDIANAVFDGADMIMLSDETAVGDFPVEAVKILKKVIKRTEENIYKTNIIN